MENPFKAGESVLTKVKTKEVAASITKVWKNEVQVKTVDGDLLWRTMYTVWRAGEGQLKRDVPAKAASKLPTAIAIPVQKPVAAKKSRKQKAPASKSRSRKRK